MFADVTETAVVVREVEVEGAEPDRYGDPVLVEQDVATLDVLFAPGSSDEPVAIGRNAVTTKPTLFADDGVDVRSTDRIRFRGETYDVDGDPQVWRGAGVVIALVQQKG